MKPYVKILIGLGLGVGLGLLLNHYQGAWQPFYARALPFLNSVGRVFIDLLKMVVSLIIFSSLVAGICHINDPKKLGRIGVRTFAFYALTTVVAIAFGLFFAFLLKPGANLDLVITDPHAAAHATDFTLSNFLLGIVPSNPFAAFTEGNILQIIVFAIFFAFATTLAGKRGKPILDAIESLSEVMYSITHVIMKFAPYGVFALMASTVTSIGLKLIVPLAMVLVCNYLACILQVVIVFCGSLKYVAKVKIAPFFKGMKDAIVLAISTNSSSATLPITLECARDHLGVSNDVSGFVISLGSTVNMNGAAIGQAVAAVFIAQAYGITLSWVQVLVIVFTALISAIGAAGVPGTGLVMLSVVLDSVGLPLEGIAFVAAIDRIREMISSAVNILGDGVAAVYVARKEKQIDLDTYHHATWLE